MKSPGKRWMTRISTGARPDPRCALNPGRAVTKGVVALGSYTTAEH